MKEMLSNAMNGNRNINMFAVPHEPRSGYPGTAAADTFAVPSAVVPSPALTGVGMAQPGLKAATRKASVDVG